MDLRLALVLLCSGIALPAQTQFAIGTITGSTPYAWAPFVTGDVDGDFDQDIVFRRFQGGIGVMVNAGDGTFTDRPAALFFPLPIFNLLLIDTDADGDLDLIAGTLSSGRARGVIYHFRNDGKGNFVNVTAATIPTRSIGGAALVALDAEGDGDLDLFVGTNYANPDELYLNDGKGTFTYAPAALPAIQRSSAAAVAGDIDGDGSTDVVITDGDLRVEFNDGRGTFREVTLMPLRQFTREPQLRDVDGDGDLDLLTLSDRADVFLNDGRGRFVPSTRTGLPAASLDLQHYAVADFDEDGDVDIWLGNGDAVCPQLFCRTVIDRLYVNDGTGSFSGAPPRAAGAPGATSLVTAMDLDIDGDTDILQVLRYSRSPDSFATRLWINRHRQLDAPATVQRGGNLQVDLFHRPGYAITSGAAALFVSLRALRVPLPGLGVVGLDPAVMLPVAAVPIPVAGQRALNFAVPNDPRLQGVQVHLQALIGDATGVGLSRAAAVRIL